MTGGQDERGHDRQGAEFRRVAVAQAFASMGVLDPGRVFLGLGTGEALNEVAATGSFGAYQERADYGSEVLPQLRSS